MQVNCSYTHLLILFILKTQGDYNSAIFLKSVLWSHFLIEINFLLYNALHSVGAETNVHNSQEAIIDIEI